MPLSIPNPTTNKFTYSALSEPIEASVITLPLFANTGFTVPNYILLENIGSQTAEIVSTTALTGNTSLTCSAVKYSHPQNAPVVFYPANEITVYKSTTGSTGPFTLWATQSIDVTNQNTMFFDVNATPECAYYSVFVNTLTSWTSPQSSVFTTSGVIPNSFRDIKNRTRVLFKDMSISFISEAELGIYINEGYQILQQEATITNKSWRTKLSPITNAIIETQEYPLPTDCWEVMYVWSSLGTTNFYTCLPGEMNSIWNIQYGYYPYMANNGYNFNMLAMPGIFEFYYINGGNIGFYPFFNGSFKLLYYPTSSLLVNDTDLPYTPINDFAYMLVDYVLLRAYEKSGRADLQRVSYLKEKWTNDVDSFKGFMQQRQVQFSPSVQTTDTRYLDPIQSDISQNFSM